MDLLLAIDREVFLFLNRTISTPAGDLLWPIITDYDRVLPIRLLLVAVWLLLLWKGGRRGRTAALLVLPLLVITDQFSSGVLKDLFARSRPCHEVNGIPIIQGIHLLVDCGPGKSFPSSHAVNNFALAILFSSFFRKWAPAFFAWAALVAISRVAVGVHFPSDIAGGALIGALLGLGLVRLWRIIELHLPPPVGIRQGEVKP